MRLRHMSFLREMSPDEEEELIEKVANFIVSRGMETPTKLFLEMAKPMSFVGSQLFLIQLYSYLEPLGINTYKLTSFLGKRGNLERLIRRIDELVEERKIREKESKGSEGKDVNVFLRYWRLFKEKIRNTRKGVK